MAQGAIKTKKPLASTRKKRQSVLGPRKGARVIPAKKAILVQHDKMTMKYSAGLTAMTERILGAKAGHLELLKGGKKNKDNNDAKDANPKGGSKKFG